MDLRDLRPTYFVRTPEGKPPQYWFSHPLVKGWAVVYRLTYRGEGAKRRARIHEMRIVPGLPAEFHPTNDYGDRWRAKQPNPSGQIWKTVVGPFPFEALRQKITERFFSAALATLPELLPDHDSDEEWGHPATQLEPALPKGQARRPGRPPKHPRLHYAKIAVEYHDVEHVMEKATPGASSLAILAKRHNNVPKSIIGRWLRIARQFGFLTPALERGSRGSQATPAAYEFIERSKKK